MNIKTELKREGIEEISQIDTLIVNSIAKNTAHRLTHAFPILDLKENDIFNKIAKLNMYRAHMTGNMTEASYFYKNASIYFNEGILDEDLEEFAIHECIHHLQEVKDDKNNLIRMGLCNYSNGTSRPTGLALNEAAVQYMASEAIEIDPDFEKYYGITLFTPSPSYYAIECALLNEIVYFTGTNLLYKSTLFSNDDFKIAVTRMTSEKVYQDLQSSFDKILKLEDNIIKINDKINMLEDGSPKFDKLALKLDKSKQKVVDTFINTQNLIIKNFFDYEFSQIEDLEQLDNLRKKLYKFSDIIGSVPNYKFFDCYYVEMMNKLEHKCNILENGGTETAPSIVKENKFLFIIRKLLSIFSKKSASANKISE